MKVYKYDEDWESYILNGDVNDISIVKAWNKKRNKEDYFRVLRSNIYHDHDNYKYTSIHFFTLTHFNERKNSFGKFTSLSLKK